MLLLILSGCETTTGSAGTSTPSAVGPPLQLSGSRDNIASFCEIATPFSWSSRDTPETIIQAKAWNAVGIKLCGWKGH